MATSVRTPAARLRATVDALPRRTRVAMLEGIERNRIVVGAYTDPSSGGICPMLAAHRSGGRTNVASFARAWDAFTGAKRPRLATRRETRALRAYLEMSLLTDDPDLVPTARPRRRPGDRNRAPELRNQPRWAWLRPTRRLDEYKDLLAAAEGQLSEQRATELLGDPAAELLQGSAVDG
jgi:hypothetical protein